MRKCKQKKKAMRTIVTKQKKRAIKAHKLAKELKTIGSTNARAKKIMSILSNLEKN